MVAFQKQMALETEDLSLDQSLLKKGIQTVIDDSSKGEYLLAFSDNELIGMLLTINEWSDWRCKTVLWIHSVYILPNRRGQGVFKEMYQYLFNFVKQNSSEYAGLRLYVDKSNQKASHVYEKLGMSKEHYDLYEWLN